MTDVTELFRREGWIISLSMRMLRMPAGVCPEHFAIDMLSEHTSPLAKKCSASYITGAEGSAEFRGLLDPPAGQQQPPQELLDLVAASQHAPVVDMGAFAFESSAKLEKGFWDYQPPLAERMSKRLCDAIDAIVGRLDLEDVNACMALVAHLEAFDYPPRIHNG